MSQTTPPSTEAARTSIFHRASVRTKILGLVAVFALFAITLGTLATTTITQIRSDTEGLARTQATVSQSLAGLKDAMWNVRNSANLVPAYSGKYQAPQIAKLQTAGNSRHRQASPACMRRGWAV